MDDLYYGAKPVDQFAISIPIDFECVRLVLKQLKDVIGRIAASEVVGERLLVEINANLLAIVGEGFIEDRLKRCSGHLV